MKTFKEYIFEIDGLILKKVDSQSGDEILNKHGRVDLIYNHDPDLINDLVKHHFKNTYITVDDLIKFYLKNKGE